MKSKLNDSVSKVAEQAVCLLHNKLIPHGLFVIDGDVITISTESDYFTRFSERHFDGMVGVYDSSVDFRTIKEDLALFA